MGNPRGFLQIRRTKTGDRPLAERIQDWREFSLPREEVELRDQAARCMDCGVPFCHKGCPLGNLIPDWNDLVYRGQWGHALEALEVTNNFPEITGRVCPAPCEASCVLNIEGEPVTIKEVERALAQRSFESGLVPCTPSSRTGKSVAVIGSGPAGLAVAQQLARRGHYVTVFERDDQIGGLLRYGIPDFKLEKHILEKRLEQMQSEGVTFVTSVNIGIEKTGDELRREFDAVVLCIGAGQPRELTAPGREFRGVHLAMDFLTQQNRRVAGDQVHDKVSISAAGKDVVILGGGDTGSDCLGTSHRQGAKSVIQIELMPQPPRERLAMNPWPEWPLIFRTSSSHEEGGTREFAMMTTAVVGYEGAVRALQTIRIEKSANRFEPIPGTEQQIPCDLLLLAMGFVGVAPSPLFEQLGVALTPRDTVVAHGGRTTVEGVFAAGDAVRGASLVVWAIAEGRRVADAVDAYLMRSVAA